VTLDDAAGDWQCEPEAAALLVKWARRRIIRPLQVFFGGDHNYGRVDASMRHVFSIGNDRDRLNLFSSNGPKTGQKGVAEAVEIASKGRAGGLASDLKLNIAIPALLHTSGHVRHDAKQVEILGLGRGGTRVELGNLAQFGDERDQPGA